MRLRLPKQWKAVQRCDFFRGEYEFKKASERSGAFLMKRRKKEKHHTQEASAQAPVRYDGSASVDRFIIVVRCPFVKLFCILI